MSRYRFVVCEQWLMLSSLPDQDESKMRGAVVALSFVVNEADEPLISGLRGQQGTEM